MFLKVFCFVIFFVVISHTFDYCDKKLCENKDHVACNHKGTFKSSCPNGIQLISMTFDRQKLFLKHHNLVRDLVAGGHHPRGFKRATRMCSMVWNPTLEYFASLNAMNCKGEHDECLRHPDFPNIGQNLYEGYTSNEITPEMAIEKSVLKWHKEAEQTFQHHLSKLDEIENIGHFTQMVNDRACEIGCALTMWTEGSRNNFYVVCNYSFGNWGNSVYKIKGGHCQTGYHRDYPHLCSPHEARIIREVAMKEK